MRSGYQLWGLTVLCGALTVHQTSRAQEAPAPQAAPEVIAPVSPISPDWWVLSRAADRSYLIDVASVARTGDELTVDVARVLRNGSPGDYSHTRDRFGVRCTTGETHVDQSSDILEDGEPTEPYVTDEPWQSIRADSLDEGVQLIACENRRPPGPSFPSIKAYIDAGRP